MRFVVVIFLLGVNCSFGQEVAVKDKLAILSYLANGKAAPCYYRSPTSFKKGMCLLEFQCKKGFFTPASDTIQAVSNHFMVAIAAYVLSDSSAYYDTAAVQYIFFENGIKKRKGRAFRTSVQQIGDLSIDDRLQIILNVLPFKAGIATRNEDSVEFILHQVTGYSPFDDLNRYSTLLGFVVYDFAYRRAKKCIVVDFVDDTRHSSVKFIPNIRNIQFILKSMRQPQ